MRVHIYDRDGNTLEDTLYTIDEAYGLSYETVLPGGMSIAQCSIPWDIAVQKPRLLGCSMVIRDGIDTRWWGRVTEVRDVVAAGDRRLELVATGPWAQLSRPRYSQVFVTGASYTANEVIAAAVFGNGEDVLLEDDNWTSTGVSIGAASFSNQSVQEVIADCLRVGDTTGSVWSFTILPPATKYAQTWDFSDKMDISPCGNFTGASITSTGSLDLERGMYQRSGGCYRLGVGTLSNQNAYLYKTVTAGSLYTLSGWFYIDKNSTTNATSEDLFAFSASTGGLICVISASNSNEVLHAYVDPTSTSYAATGNQVVSFDCWHYIKATLARHASSGYIKVWYDGKRVINQTSINTGTSNIGQLDVGIRRTTGGRAKLIYFDSIIGGSGTMDTLSVTGDSPLVTETLPEPRLFRLNLAPSAKDFIISLADFGGDFVLNETLLDLENQIDGSYKSGSGMSRTTGSDSVINYGQWAGSHTYNRVPTEGLANQIRDRYLASLQEPKQKLQQFTLTVPPESSSGAPMPLSKIRAGMVFTIREKPELGGIPIGQAKYTRAEKGQPESCQVTPYEMPAQIGVEVAKRRKRERD